MFAAREREGQSAERLVSTLYELLTEPITDAPATAPTDERLVALPDATRYHRPSCVLIAGKDEATTVNSHAISERGLEPCPLCIVGQPAG